MKLNYQYQKIHPEHFNNIHVNSLSDLLDDIKTCSGYVVIDTAMCEKWAYDNTTFGIIVCFGMKYVYLDNEEYDVESFLLDLFNAGKVIVVYNAECVFQSIRNTYHIEQFPEKLIDLKRVGYLLNTMHSLNVREWFEEEYGRQVFSCESILNEYKSMYNIQDIRNIPTSVLEPYVALRSVLIMCLIRDKIDAARRQSPVLFRLEHDLIPIIVDMINNGMQIDMEYATVLYDNLQVRSDNIRDKIYNITNRELDVTNNKNSSLYLHNNNNEAVMQLIRLWRENEKNKNTYVKNIINKQVNGFIHSYFNAMGTITGRFSSSMPNLQNIPNDEKIKKMFIPNSEFYEYDYSQLEYRLFGIGSHEDSIIKAYNTGHDFHNQSAQALNVDRSMGKLVNYLVVNNGGYKLLSQKANITIDQSREYIQRFWNKYPALRKFVYSTADYARRNGFVHTLLGRKIIIEDNFHKAPVYVIQGTGGDMIKVALRRVWSILHNTPARIVNTIHDSILIDNLNERYIKDIKNAMERFRFHSNKLNITMPISVNMQIYPNHWGSGYEYYG